MALRITPIFIVSTNIFFHKFALSACVRGFGSLHHGNDESRFVLYLKPFLKCK